MKDSTSPDRPTRPPDQSRAVAIRIAQVIVQFALLIAVLLISSGRTDWVWMWVLAGISAAILIVNLLVLPRELIAERGQPKGNVKPWDLALASLGTLPALGAPIVAGLDERFRWSPELPLAVHLAGALLMVLGQGLFTWAMASNRYFSTLVRIQLDRDHTVATGGPYRYVRHPGYVGHTVSAFSAPLLLGSLWAVIPAAVTLSIHVVRTALEDRTLLEELPGYREYAERVRYRLIPGIW